MFSKRKTDMQCLKVLTCGSVDDGKSTLIGRLLYDSKSVFDDQMTTLEADSKAFGTTGDDVDFALLLDGLESEREQGITIDVAYRFLTIDKRKYIIADTPGHVQYTRNMVTGASTSDLAILIVDARKGLLEQTKRHAYIVTLLGIKHLVIAINKMDLVDYAEDTYNEIKDNLSKFAELLDYESLTFIPTSARLGDNVITKSDSMAWYKGPALLDYLDTIKIKDAPDQNFRMPVQWVNRPNQDFRGYCGTVASGKIKAGDKISILPSNQSAKIKDIIVADKTTANALKVKDAVKGDAVTLTLDQEIDISRGDVLSDTKDNPTVTDQFAANIIWVSEKPLYAGRSYLIKMNAKTVPATITEIKHKIDTQRLNKIPAKAVEMNDVAFCNLSTQSPVVFDAYEDNRSMGSFVIIDRMTNETVGAGMVVHSLYRARNIFMEDMKIDKQARSGLNKHKPFILWFTGLSGSGKSTIANLVEQKLHAHELHTYILDGDNVRHGLNRDLGFVEADRIENIRRIGEVSKLMVDAGLITLVSFISPFISEREQTRALVDDGEFIEVYVDTPLEVCQERDTKGLYKKAIAGEIKNFTGISSPYEPPPNPELVVQTENETPEESADKVVNYLKERGLI